MQNNRIPRTPAQLARPTSLHRSTHTRVSTNVCPLSGETTRAVSTTLLEMDAMDGELQVRFKGARISAVSKGPGDPLRRPWRS
jgi:hypothetical protein